MLSSCRISVVKGTVNRQKTDAGEDSSLWPPEVIADFQTFTLFSGYSNIRY